ncbi:MAG TPA: hypothetical protein VJA40_05035 [archaeon]|nr:hypothetical protein [archaeon]
MAKFDTIKAEEIKYGNNTFLEIALKKVQGEDGVESKVISLSKGWYPQNAEDPNTKRFKTAFGFPAEREILDKFVAALQQMQTAAAQQEASVPEEA